MLATSLRMGSSGKLSGTGSVDALLHRPPPADRRTRALASATQIEFGCRHEWLRGRWSCCGAQSVNGICPSAKGVAIRRPVLCHGKGVASRYPAEQRELIFLVLESGELSESNMNDAINSEQWEPNSDPAVLNNRTPANVPTRPGSVEAPRRNESSASRPAASLDPSLEPTDPVTGISAR